MPYDFDTYVDRCGTYCAKWERYGEDVLPLWVADMDFRSPEPVIRALQDRIDHGIFGYGMEPSDARPVVLERLKRLYDWDVSPEALLFIPGVVRGFNLAAHAVGESGDGVLLQTPVYYPMFRVADYAERTLDEMELTRQADGRYVVDMDLMARTLTPRTRLFILCNPHNPVGRVYTRAELEGMAQMCLRNDMIICSDEIHAELLFDEQKHIPIATLSPEVSRRTITLLAPSKTFNIAGLHFSVAVIEDEALRERFQTAMRGLMPSLDILAWVAGITAYREGDPWLAEALSYMDANRHYLAEYVHDHLPGIEMALPEGTFLAWLDCRGAGLDETPHAFFLREAKVALNDGATFGKGGEGFARLNFGCPRSLLTQALDLMRGALERRA